MSTGFELPDNLPVPQDDGGAAHLAGMDLPSITLKTTGGEGVDLSRIPGRTVLYIYPLTGRPGRDLPDGWDGIPGARGCTPQSCGFRDHFEELAKLGVAKVFGLSTQASDYQREAKDRLHLPFELLSDSDFAFGDAARLPDFEADGMRLYKRMALVIDDGRVTQVFYPVFPPDRNAQDVIDWIAAERAA